MHPRDLKEVLDALSQTAFAEFELKTKDYEIKVKRAVSGEVVVAAPVAVAAQPAPVIAAPVAAPVVQEAPKAPAAPETKAVKTTPVKAPIVGTFYASSSPDAAPYVKVGDRVAVGQVLCIVEAMKLMNEIESDVAGVVREILVKNSQPVEYGQDLFLIEPA